MNVSPPRNENNHTDPFTNNCQQMLAGGQQFVNLFTFSASLDSADIVAKLAEDHQRNCKGYSDHDCEYHPVYPESLFPL